MILLIAVIALLWPVNRDWYLKRWKDVRNCEEWERSDESAKGSVNREKISKAEIVDG